MKWRKRLFATSGIVVLVLCNFVIGFYACLHLKRSTAAEIRHQYLHPRGDAPPAVHSGVRAALQAFQDGYNKRDPKQIDAFMSRLFAKDADVLLLGTDSDEWARGYSAVGQFIRNDWAYWGQFRFDVDDAIISSAGDVAWVTSVGEVVKAPTTHPIRFSAVLVRRGDRWLFRQLQFQWDERDPATAELWRASTHAEIARLLLKKAQDVARNAVGMVAIDKPANITQADPRAQVSGMKPTASSSTAASTGTAATPGN